MITSIVIAILAILIIALALALVATLREVVLLRGDVSALAQLITSPPVPVLVDKDLPDSLHRNLPDSGDQGDTVVVLFLSDDCGPCRQIADNLQRVAELHPTVPSSLLAVLRSRSLEASPVKPALDELRIKTVVDNGRIADECDIRGTPGFLAYDRSTRRVTDYSYGGDVAWIVDRLSTTKILAIAQGEEGQT